MSKLKRSRAAKGAMSIYKQISTAAVWQVVRHSRKNAHQKNAGSKRNIFGIQKYTFGIEKIAQRSSELSSLLDPRLPLQLEKCQQSQGSWGVGVGILVTVAFGPLAPSCVLKVSTVTGTAGVGVGILVPVEGLEGSKLLANRGWLRPPTPRLPLFFHFLIVLMVFIFSSFLNMSFHHFSLFFSVADHVDHLLLSIIFMSFRHTIFHHLS